MATTASRRSRNKSTHRTELQRRNMSASIQWLALVVIFVLIVTAVFVLTGDGGGGGGGRGG